jgi:hypothetical protein
MAHDDLVCPPSVPACDHPARRLAGIRFTLSYRDGGVMSGRRSLIKGYFWRCADRGCGHVFGLSRGEI